MTKIILGKKMKKITIVLVTTALFTLSANAECKPKWCDSKKLSVTEDTICSDSTLRASDALLNSIYKEIGGKEFKESQKSWLKERNSLFSKVQIFESYMKRIDALYPELNPHKKIKRLYKAIVNNQPKVLANLIKFPKTIIINGKENKFESKAKFLEKYSTIFTKKYREHIAKEKPSPDMFSNYQGIMLGDGIIWFTEEGNLQSLNK